MNNNEMSFEEALNKLDLIIADMESGKLSLDESIQAYESAINIIVQCRTKLDNSRRKIEVLKQSGGIVNPVEINDDFQ